MKPPDSHRTYPEPKRDRHTVWPALPFVLLLVMVVVFVVVACELLRFV